MKLEYNKILEKANHLYADTKLKQMQISDDSVKYLAPEQIPQIQSDQVKMVLKALIDEINARQ